MKLITLGSALVLLTGCVSDNARLAELQAENATLRANLESLQEALQNMSPDELQTIPSFTVGLAASESEFDPTVFEQLLQDSLGVAAQEQSVSVARETDERQVAKVRGMLMQQYLAASELPVQLSNLSFKLQSLDNEFKIGGRIVPRGAGETAPVDGTGVRVVHAQPISAVMQRDSAGRYSIPYEELGGGSGRIMIQTSDSDILNTTDEQRVQRQGDISFNWSLDLKQVEAYRVDGFRGDVGLFLTNMRYSGVQSSIAQYQTLRDAVFLFGYGRYVTSVINQIRTPSYITRVEVAPISPQAFEALQGRLDEQEVIDIVGAATWETCEFVDFDDEEKIWGRPAGVPFPFLSRQISGEGDAVFYLKYSIDGGFFIGEYGR